MQEIMSKDQLAHKKQFKIYDKKQLVMVARVSWFAAIVQDN